MKHRRFPKHLIALLAIMALILVACSGGAATTEDAAPSDAGAGGAAASDAASDDEGNMAGVRPGSLHNLDDYQAMTGETLEFNEAPMLAEMVAAGDLPPVAERLPDNPLVVVPWNEVGEYGGAIRWDEFNVGYDLYLRHMLTV